MIREIGYLLGNQFILFLRCRQIFLQNIIHEYFFLFSAFIFFSKTFSTSVIISLQILSVIWVLSFYFIRCRQMVIDNKHFDNTIHFLLYFLRRNLQKIQFKSRRTLGTGRPPIPDISLYRFSSMNILFSFLHSSFSQRPSQLLL